MKPRLIYSTLKERLHDAGDFDAVVSIGRQFGVSFDEIAGRARHVPVVRARHAVWRHLYERWSVPFIARLWGVHHTTVYSALGLLDKKNDAPREEGGGSPPAERREDHS